MMSINPAPQVPRMNLLYGISLASMIMLSKYVYYFYIPTFDAYPSALVDDEIKVHK